MRYILLLQILAILAAREVERLEINDKLSLVHWHGQIWVDFKPCFPLIQHLRILGPDKDPKHPQWHYFYVVIRLKQRYSFVVSDYRGNGMISLWDDTIPTGTSCVVWRLCKR